MSRRHVGVAPPAAPSDREALYACPNPLGHTRYRSRFRVRKSTSDFGNNGHRWGPAWARRPGTAMSEATKDGGNGATILV